MTLAEIASWWPDSDFHFSMKMRPLNPGRFFSPADRSGKLLDERRRILEAYPERHCVLPSDPAVIQAVLQAAQAWTGLKPNPCLTPLEQLEWLGGNWEPDFLVLTPDENGRMIFRCGCVCFPSSWAPESKQGLPVKAIHDMVPGMNQAIGDRIHIFLSRLTPETGWARINWGLSTSEELNQHPNLQIEAPGPETDPASLWLRIETQLITKLQGSSAILFGIRIDP